jgi:tetratricopeptide (TPR) repeat protein
MDLSSLLPSSDLLQKARGVERGLKQRRRLGAFGWYGFILFGAFELWLEVEKLGWVTRALEQGAAVGLPIWVPAVVTVLALFLLLLGTWSTFWLNESRQPFRYTCSISSFGAIGDEQSVPGSTGECMGWLPHDLTRLLNERVQRFLFAGDARADAAGEGDDGANQDGDAAQGGQNDSCIHIRGHYVVRAAVADAQALEVEVMPRVRMGAASNAEVMAQSIILTLPQSGEAKALDRNTYEDLLEQVYHSIVSELYRQLKEDVQTKIALLPTDRFRAIALLYEADDYAHSNTLHAYDEARELYRQAAGLMNPVWRDAPKTPWPRLVWQARCLTHRARAALRRVEASYRPRVADRDMLCARALIGYARMLLFRRPLAGLVGKTVNPIFEAKPVVEQALRIVEKLGGDVVGRQQSLFDTLVTLALTYCYLGHTKGARDLLTQARTVDPQRAEYDTIYIFTSGLTSSSQRTRLGLLRRAVELSPRFEVVQFTLARELENLWRSRDVLESSSADLALLEYRKLLKINPGNLGAWANSGYISWLLGTDERLKAARKHFEQGLRYKGIKREIFVSELDYGLARIFAEQGDVVRAYQHYISAVAASIAREDTSDYHDYFFHPLAPAMRGRFDRYYANVRRGFRRALQEDAKRGANPQQGAQERKRIRDSVHAFVLNDLGEAYAHTGDAESAVTTFNRAIAFNPNYVLPYHNLATFDADSLGRDPHYYLKRVIELQPTWPQGRLALARYYSHAAPDALVEETKAEEARIRAAQIQTELVGIRSRSQQHHAHIREIETSLGAPVAPVALESREVVERREKLEKELESLDKQMLQHRRNAAERLQLAQQYRDDAREIARALLPHAWLWGESELDPRILRASALRKELRWEREFSDLHAQALYVWALRFVYDTREIDKALQFLSHLRKHYWPADYDLLRQWINLNIRRTDIDQRRKKECAEDALQANPYLVHALPRLEELGFTAEEQIKILHNAIAFEPEDRYVRRLRTRLADVYAATAAKQSDPREIAASYRRAAEAAPDDLHRHEALADALEQAAGDTELDLLEEAVVAATKAAERYDSTPQQLARLRKKCEIVKNCANADHEVELLFGAAAVELRPVERPLLVEYSADLETVFRPEAGSPADIERKTALGNLNEGLFYELGVRFPPVEFRRSRDAAAKTSYVISLWDTPLERGDLHATRHLFGVPADALRAEKIKAEEAVNPANGNAAAWVHEDDLPKARAFAARKQIHDWNPFSYVVLHLAAVFRRNALDFLRADDVLRLLKDWRLDTGADELNDDGLLIEFTNCLRALVADQFRIWYPVATLRAFREVYVDGVTLTTTVERMRSHPELRKQNSLHRVEPTLIRLGPKFERIVEEGLRVGQNVVLALKPETTQELLATIRTFTLDLRDPNPFLLCKQELRPWVRKLVELEFPFFRVVSEPEALPEGLPFVRKTLEHEA